MGCYQPRKRFPLSTLACQDQNYIIDQWKQIGYDCTVIWDTDLKAFLENPDAFL